MIVLERGSGAVAETVEARPELETLVVGRDDWVAAVTCLHPRGEERRRIADSVARILLQTRDPAAVDDEHWAAVVWQRRSGSVVLARSRWGAAELYWSHARGRLVVSSRLREVRDHTPELTPDRLVLGAALLGVDHGGGDGRTAYEEIRGLDHGQRVDLVLDRPFAAAPGEYWRLARPSPRARTLDHDELAEELRDHLDRAVADAVPEAGDVACDLSSGLDSSAIATSLAHQHSGAHAFTWATPAAGAGWIDPRQIADEWPWAAVTAGAAPGLLHHRVTSDEVGIVEWLSTGLEVVGEPVARPSGHPWMQATTRAVAELGATTWLCGQAGNAAFSYAGTPVRIVTPRGSLRSAVGRLRPGRRPTDHLAHRDLRRDRRLAEDVAGLAADFEAELDADLGLGRLRRALRRAGAFPPDVAAPGLVRFDPTADARLVTFVLSLPPEVFGDPETGIRRWLCRQSQRGRVPDEVRLNRRFGHQASDLVPRLRADAEAVHDLLATFRTTAAADHMDLGRLDRMWRHLLATDPDPAATSVALTRFVPALQVGMFLGRW